jgi:sRNA-binding regulator protein Hfq
MGNIVVGKKHLLEFLANNFKIDGVIETVMDDGIIFRTKTKTSFIYFSDIKTLYNMDDLVAVDLGGY